MLSLFQSLTLCLCCDCSYQAVVKVMNVLKHQLTRAKKDIDTLTRMKKEAIDDPFTFVLDLKSKVKKKGE